MAAEIGTSGDIQFQVSLWSARARILAHQGSFDTAESLAREAVDLSEPTDWLIMKGDALMDLAEVLTLAGRPDEAKPFIERALGMFELKEATSYVEFAARALAELGSR